MTYIEFYQSILHLCLIAFVFNVIVRSVIKV